jgi:Uma2 family endonuclease
MATLINDPDIERAFRARRKRLGQDKYDEVWDGVLVVPALPNNEHQALVQRLTIPFSAIIDWDRGDMVLPGANVSDRRKSWKKNYRCPDVVVRLAGGRAVDCGTHWFGGPDFLVEIVSHGDDPQRKFDFYAKVKSREVMVIDRDPWALELYQLRRGKLRLTGRSDAANPAALASGVLPLTFRLRDGKPRPTIVVTHTGTGQTWTA